MATMYDSVNAQSIPADAQVAAGYVDGSWPSFNAVVQRTPNAQHVSITTRSTHGVRVCDVESGDDTPQQGAQWAKDEIAAGRRPTLYCNRSTWFACVSALQAVGVAQGDVDWWIADWTGLPHLLSGTVATQYANDVSGCDLSLTNGVWPMQAQFQMDPVTFDSPAIAYLAWPHGGFYLLSEKGGIYAFGGAPFLGTADGQRFFAGRTAARLDYMAAGSVSGYAEGYVITDTAGETYRFDGHH
jgi:hypothetical protein